MIGVGFILCALGFAALSARVRLLTWRVDDLLDQLAEVMDREEDTR